MCADANFRINVVAEQHNIVATSPNHTRQFKPYLTSSVKWTKSLKLWNLLPFTAYYYRGHVLMTLVSTLNTHRTLRVRASNLSCRCYYSLHQKKELDSFHCLWCATSSAAVWQSKAVVTLFEVLACIIYRSDYNDLLSMYLNTQGQCFQIQDRANK